jgi:transcription initiation factor TFIIB
MFCRRRLKVVLVQEEKQGCPECCVSAIIVHDPESGEDVCENCGLVVNNVSFESGYGIRAFNPEELRKKMQTGSPETLLLHEKGAMTHVGLPGEVKDFYGKKLNGEGRNTAFRLKKMQTHCRIKSNQERNLASALRSLNLISDKLGLPTQTRVQAAFNYRSALKKDLVRGRSIAEMVAAAVYLACRDGKAAHTPEEISKAASVPVKKITCGYRLLLEKLDRQQMPPVNNAVSYITQLGSKLGVSGEQQGEAIRLRMKLNKLCVGKSPLGLAAALLYIVCDVHSQSWKDKVTQKVIGEVAGITEVTIRKRYKELQRELLKIAGLQPGAQETKEGKEALMRFLARKELLQ